MEIIKCKCGYYKQLNDELCPNCKADYSLGAEYEVLADQETAYMRWVNLGEKGFNDYMKAASAPHFMLCPKCRFKMLVTETQCPKCNTKVKYKDSFFTRPEKLFLGFSRLWLNALIVLGVLFVIFVFIIILSAIL